jgi:hypothetical protein
MGVAGADVILGKKRWWREKDWLTVRRRLREALLRVAELPFVSNL